MSHYPPDASPRIQYRTTPALRLLPESTREALLREPPSRAAHDLIFERHADLFDQLEIGPPPEACAPVIGSAKITFWNVERGHDPDEQASPLRAQNAVAHLICELDLGMARTDQRHTTKDLTDRLDSGYAFAVEFLELGLGNAREQAEHAGETNQAGFHGAAIISPHLLVRPAVVRLSLDGAWFNGEHGERRVGGRIAILATLMIDGQSVTLACVHLESHGNSHARAEETTALLDAIDAYAPDQPVLIGGDFNTSTLDRHWSKAGPAAQGLSEERVINPIPFEPLFKRLGERGYVWDTANDMTKPTQRWHPGQYPTRTPGKVDWFFSRGLEVRNARTVPAVNTRGRPLSDHELLTVTVKPEPRS